jgi:hypothetical protein
MGRPDRQMWTCPDCGRSFANANQWHSCVDLSVADHLATKTKAATTIFWAVVEALEACGEFRVHAQKTRIAFISRMTFGGVALARKWIDLSVILPAPVDDGRVRRLELYGPTSWGHTIRLHQPAEVDDDVRNWLCQGLMRGDQKTLDPAAEVSPLSGRLLQVFWTGARVVVRDLNGESVVRVPGYVADALALVDDVLARVAGVRYETGLVREGGTTYVAVDPSTGLGGGDETDLFLEVM